MSTFSNTPSHRPIAEGHAFATVPADDVLVQNFRTGDAEATRSLLNTDLNMQLGEHTFARIQAYFRDSARRDPTMGEMRLLDALDRHGKDSPARIAVGEIITKSSLQAETWADMMQKHGELYGVGSVFRGKHAIAAPPCTLREALSLVGDCLNPAIVPSTHRILTSLPYQEAIASAEGYTPVARVLVGDETRTLWTRTCDPLAVTPAHTGDFILHLSKVEPSRMQDLVAEASASPRSLLGEIRAVADHSLLLTLLALCPAVHLYADRLIRENHTDGRLPEDMLCAYPLIQADGICDYLMRVPAKQIQGATEFLKQHGIHAVVCGRIPTGGQTVIQVRDNQNNRDVPVVNLSTAFLLSMSPPYLHGFEVETCRANTAAPHLPIMARMPAVPYPENGMTPDGTEAVALTIHEGAVMRIPEVPLLMSTLSTTIHEGNVAFTQAADLTVAVTNRLRAADVDPRDMILSVSLTAASGDVLRDGSLLSAIMGIYRVAAERGLPVEDSVITVGPVKGLLRVTITAHAKEVTCLSEHHICPPDHQWHISGDSCHKESPGFLLPVIRRPFEGCLKALSAALNRDESARCIIQPIIMDEQKAADSSAVDTPSEEIRYSLNPESVQQLCEQMHNWLTPVFCMSEEDTRSLLAFPGVLESLNSLIDMGYPVLVLGESCKPFAENGLLPACLTSVHRMPAQGATATVTYAFPADPTTRLLRGKLLAVQAALDTRPLLQLHLSDGTVIPDGFTSRSGKVLGILNGVDTTVLPILRKHNFGF